MHIINYSVLHLIDKDAMVTVVRFVMLERKLPRPSLIFIPLNAIFQNSSMNG